MIGYATELAELQAVNPRHCGQDTHGGWLLKAGAPIPCCEDCRALALTA